MDADASHWSSSDLLNGDGHLHQRWESPQNRASTGFIFTQVQVGTPGTSPGAGNFTLGDVMPWNRGHYRSVHGS